MKRKKDDIDRDFDQKALSAIVLAGVIAVLIALVISAYYDLILPEYTALLKEIGLIMLEVGLVMLSVGVLLVFIIKVAIRLDRQTVEMFVDQKAKDISVRLAEQNSRAISPRLQQFLFGVLSQNNEFLHLPLGKDFTCLTPRNSAYSYRDTCVFYHFDLIAPERPSMDMSTLRQIVQQFVEGELYNYGIGELGVYFRSKTGYTWWSVYVDRIRYSEAQRCLTFDMLYVCTEEAAQYMAKAIQRDNGTVKLEREVCDDDLQ